MKDKNPLTYSVKRSEVKRSPNTEKTLQTSHFPQQVSSFQPYTTCPFHSHDYITHLCLTCDYQCLCGTCLKEGNHKTHQIRNIEKSVKIVDRILNQYAIRLRSKSDILTLLHESLCAHKTEIYQEFLDNKKYIEDKFNSLIQMLIFRQDQIIRQVKNAEESYFQRVDHYLKQISEQTRFSINLISIITESLEKLEPPSLCTFFSHQKSIIQETLSEYRIENIKGRMPDFKPDYNFADFESMADKINNISIQGNEKKLLRSVSPKRALKKVGAKNMGKTVIRGQKARDSFMGAQTPKNGKDKENKYIESHKDIIKFFRSPNKHNQRGLSSGKLISAPESPDNKKQFGSKNPSPARGDQFKKKARKTKK